MSTMEEIEHGVARITGGRSLWLDCDPGHDDAFAILLAAMHPRLHLIGITTVHGNASVADTAWNALSILTTLDKHRQVPVFAGAQRPFCREPVYADDIHGEHGLAGPTLVYPRAQLLGSSVMQACLHLIHTPPGLVWLVATGALTNIALMMRVMPGFVEHIAGLCIMGGAVGDGFTHVTSPGERFGNVSPSAEFNFYCDPEAAQAVFSDPVLCNKTFLVTLDLSHQVIADEQFQDLILNGTPVPETLTNGNAGLHIEQPPSSERRLFHELLVYFSETYARKFNLHDGPPLHDVLAVALVLDGHFPEDPIFSGGEERYNVQVVTNGERTDETAEVGRTIVTRSEDGRGVRIFKGCDKARVFAALNRCLEIVDERTRTAEAARTRSERRGRPTAG